MKTILIEKVTNGFLVRPFNPVPAWACSPVAEVPGNLFVYKTIEEVAADLPRLIEYEESVTKTTRT